MSHARHKITAAYKFHTSGKGHYVLADAILALGADLDADRISPEDALVHLSFIEESGDLSCVTFPE